jgi:hypothetical protein
MTVDQIKRLAGRALALRDRVDCELLADKLGLKKKEDRRRLRWLLMTGLAPPEERGSAGFNALESQKVTPVTMSDSELPTPVLKGLAGRGSPLTEISPWQENAIRALEDAAE